MQYVIGRALALAAFLMTFALVSALCVLLGAGLP
jgi:hypothetical protein